jgi:hypothetical protein
LCQFKAVKDTRTSELVKENRGFRLVEDGWIMRGGWGEKANFT